MTAAKVLDAPTPTVDTCPLRVSVPFGVLKAALTTTGIGVAARPMVSVLAGVLITTGPDGAHLTTYDYQTAVRVRVGPPSTESARMLVGFHGLARVVRSLGRGVPASKVRDMPITITRIGDHGVAYRVEADGWVFTAPTMPVEDYPPTRHLFTQPAEHAAEVDRDRLVTAIGQVARAAGHDSTLPRLTGIKLEADAGGLTLVTTDRFRLGVARVPGVSDDTEWEALVPAAPLARFAPRLPVGPAQVETITGEMDGSRYVRVSTNTTQVQAVIRVLDVEFVKYRALLPNDHTMRFTMDRAALIIMCERLQTGRGQHAPCILTITPDGVRASSGGPDEGLNESPLLRVVHNGATTCITVAFNPGYLLAAARSFTGEQVALGFNTPARPVLIADHVDDLAAGTAVFRHLLMPARLPSVVIGGRP